MPGDEAISDHPGPLGSRQVNEVRITAIYQRNGAVALTRSHLFPSATALQTLLAWAKSFEDLDVEFIRLEIDAE